MPRPVRCPAQPLRSGSHLRKNGPRLPPAPLRPHTPLCPRASPLSRRLRPFPGRSKATEQRFKPSSIQHSCPLPSTSSSPCAPACPLQTHAPGPRPGPRRNLDGAPPPEKTCPQVPCSLPTPLCHTVVCSADVAYVLGSLLDLTPLPVSLPAPSGRHLRTHHLNPSSARTLHPQAFLPPHHTCLTNPTENQHSHPPSLHLNYW